MQYLRNKLFIWDKRLRVRKENQVYILVAASIIIFLIMFLLNHLTPIEGDDYIYSFVNPVDYFNRVSTLSYTSGVRIHSFGEIFHSLKIHYYLWGGRMVAHFFVEMLLMLDPLIADILNSLVYLLSIILIYLHVRGRNKEHDVSLFLLISFLMWLFQPSFSDCYLWITGSCNYLWCTCIILLFLLPYRLYDSINNKSIQIPKSILMLCFGVIAGCTNENTGLGLIAMILIWICAIYRSKKKIPLWTLSGLIGALIGFGILMAAPGNYIRGSLNPTENLHALVSKLLILGDFYFCNLGVLTAGAVFFAILLLQFNRSATKKISPIAYFLGGFISIAALIFSPEFPPRAWFGGIVFAIILFGILFFNQNKRYLFVRYIRRSLVLICALAFLLNSATAFKAINAVNKGRTEQENEIREAKKLGKTIIVLKPLPPLTKFSGSDFGFLIPAMESYYGIKITFEPNVPFY